MTISNDQEQVLINASKLIKESSHVIALVGAGMSAESGIPTYRGPGGLWSRIGEPDPRSFETFLQDPKLWWERMLDRANIPAKPEQLQFREALESARPNPGHYALASLEDMGVLKYIITQNVDNLHQLAGNTKVAEIHGNRTLLRCMDCNWRTPRKDFEIRELPPSCPNCGGLVKGDGVMFGEPIPSDVLEKCLDETAQCDCMLVLGTSGTVYPAAGFPIRALEHGAHLIEINTSTTPISHIVDVRINGPSGKILPAIVDRISNS